MFGTVTPKSAKNEIRNINLLMKPIFLKVFIENTSVRTHLKNPNLIMRNLFSKGLVLVLFFCAFSVKAQIDYGTIKLYNSLTDQEILNITNSSTYDLNVVGDSLNIEAVPPVPASVSSVTFTTSIGVDNTENVAPYAYQKDNEAEGFFSWLTLPNYLDTAITFTIQYWSGSSGTGTELGDDVFTITFTKPTPDTQNPTAPTLSSTGHAVTTADLSWSGATDNVGVTGYKVFKDGVLEATLGTVSTYQVTGLTASTTYSFTVTALDAATNESAPSNAVSVTTNSSADTQAPTAPTLSSSGQTDTTANLSWSGATDNVGVTGYKVFKDGVLEITLGTVSSYQVTGLTASTSYSFTVRALDAAAIESSPSNAVSVTTNAGSGGGSSVWTESGSTASYTGEVAIGTTSVPSGYKLAVEGNIRTREIRVDQDTWPDYVFTKDYDLPTLDEIKKHIEEKGHLPNIPSAKEVEENGVELGNMNRLLLEKIEELTLHVIKQQQLLEEQQIEMKKLRNQILPIKVK
ncbi:fibronectin type III domain-containing protein [Muricauda sp. MAR_2010_75]|uniref:fibronectin type III domain-containing protein n=1 Tax=Allomuricauda sp. MAR_2010_75 TaxID=1250232 RepID=UPI000689272F|nr:fibronectin type III domain-containing protein [Muricauda sp. MAR_2010_75]